MTRAEHIARVQNIVIVQKQVWRSTLQTTCRAARHTRRGGELARPHRRTHSILRERRQIAGDAPSCIRDASLRGSGDRIRVMQFTLPVSFAVCNIMSGWFTANIGLDATRIVQQT